MKTYQQKYLCTTPLMPTRAHNKLQFRPTTFSGLLTIPPPLLPRRCLLSLRPSRCLPESSEDCGAAPLAVKEELREEESRPTGGAVLGGVLRVFVALESSDLRALVGGVFSALATELVPSRLSVLEVWPSTTEMSPRLRPRSPPMSSAARACCPPPLFPC